MNQLSIKNLSMGLLLGALFYSCSGVSPIDKGSVSGCHSTETSGEVRRLITSARVNSGAMAQCFKNFLQFEKNKKQKFELCNQFVVRKSGKVSYVQSFGENPKKLPKGLKMCIEQAIWQMDFKSLQLEREYNIKYPLVLKSI